ncbi:MAG: DUF3192 domain-containing protein [Ignavibacteriae bacterium]|nr:DUF3192 domain-containing protein [Ignavibacteria bacterium]MBI3363360.1 DUF3192 domain-containing protein [Ignavibacteriota bacterium]
MKYLCIAVALFALSGCAGSVAWHSMRMGSTNGEAEDNNKKMMQLEIGQPKDSVLAIMGQPTRREAYRLDNNRAVEFLFYRTRGWSNQESADNDEQFTPMAFEDKKLIGWGRNFYDNIVKIAVQINGK